MRPPRGTLLLVALLLVSLVATCGRRLYPEGEGPPAFFLEKHRGISVLLGSGFPNPGVHQFSDGITVRGVIKMTELSLAPGQRENPLLDRPLADGEALDIAVSELHVSEIIVFWMPAEQRMALGIPLHPDRMSLADWEALTGIGPKMAEAIERERQQNGDFGSLAGLMRVKGVGSKRIAGWEKFFQPADMLHN